MRGYRSQDVEKALSVAVTNAVTTQALDASKGLNFHVTVVRDSGTSLADTTPTQCKLIALMSCSQERCDRGCIPPTRG
jgi:hypothetical protein